MDFHAEGCTVLPSVVSPSVCDALIAEIGPLSSVQAGTRGLLGQAWCTALATTLKAHPGLAPLLPPQPVAVQCTLFAKSPERNWAVALHQDLSIPVAHRTNDPACTGWSEKEGVRHTQPPAAVLDTLVAVRLHLDPCGPDNGPLRVVPGSHLGGVRSVATADERLRERVCPVPRGGALVMRPLLLHASAKANTPGPRRVLHFLFGPARLPHGLTWHQAV